jgi:ribosomal-protein-alanine N-acetyltransferase
MSDDIRTGRLVLRRWRDDDRALFAEMNADPRVMEHFPALLSRAESDAVVDRIQAHFEKHDFGLWAVEVTGGDPFIGFVGITHVPFEAHFTPAVEIGWRLSATHWGRGYAREAAKAALEVGFARAKLDEIVSMTAVDNRKSRRVMEAIGMHRNLEDDFDHPRIPEGHRLKRHVLYRVSRADWSNGMQNASAVTSGNTTIE